MTCKGYFLCVKYILFLCTKVLQDLLNQSRECETLNQEIKSLKWKLELIETSYSECRNQRDELYKTVENLQGSIKEHLNKSG